MQLLLQSREHVVVTTKRFAGDGLVPNSTLPAVIYRNTIDFGALNPEEAMAELKALADRNDWNADWHGSVFRRVHYHSTAHECLVVYRGYAKLRLGGSRFGEQYGVSQGDAIFIPAGVGHQLVEATTKFSVFGLYPLGQRYDTRWNWEKYYAASRRRIAKVFLPDTDPLYGKTGPLLTHWGND